MALAERLLPRVNRPGDAIVDHRTYAFVGDGCLMEGISHEACSLAGTWGLGKLMVLYDDNGISIDGETKGWFTDDTPGRFEAYGWNVIRDVDGHDADAVDRAITAGHRVTDRPTLVCCKTVIGKGSPNKAGSHEVHGAALGEKEVAATRASIGWTHPPFEVPAPIYAGWNARERGALAEQAWAERFARYRTAHPALAAEFTRRMHGELPENWRETASAFVSVQAAKAETVATRKASQLAIEAYAKTLPELLGGSADLTGSVLTNWSGSRSLTRESPGNYIHFGVREFAMCAIANGMVLHGGLLPYVGTFLTFSDYARNALRMAALMRLRSIFVFTHDSIGLGEDGPTHQSVEHAASLRLIPNMDVWRPCDTVETAVAWAAAIERADGPACLLFTRQNVPFQARDGAQIAAIRRGGYVLAAGMAPARSEQDHRHGFEWRWRWAPAQPAGVAVRVVSMPGTGVSTGRTPRTARACCRRACRASPWKRARPRAGTSTSARSTTGGAPSSASTRSANPRRPACCSSISASPSRTSLPP
jgi:transketolase